MLARLDQIGARRTSSGPRSSSTCSRRSRRNSNTDVQFAHQLFQEFFAARVLAEQPEPALVHVEWRAAAIAPGVHALLDTLGRGERLPELPATDGRRRRWWRRR